MHCTQCGTAIGINDKCCFKCGAVSPSIHEEVSIQHKSHEPSSTPIPVSPAFRDPTKLTKWLKYFLYASLVINTIALFSDMLQYQLLSDFKLGIYSSEELASAAAEVNNKRQQIIGLFQFSIAIATSVLFAIWIYRANFNARQLGAQGMKFSPGWSIGYYFIPILWFWKPYQAMREIWQASRAPSSWKSVERGAILPWWWSFFLVFAILSNASLRTTTGAKEISEFLTSIGITIAADIVSIPATIIALILVKQIYKMQISHVQSASNIAVKYQQIA